MPREDIPYNQEAAIYKLKTPKGVNSCSGIRYSCVPGICEYFECFLFYVYCRKHMRGISRFFFFFNEAKTGHSYIKHIYMLYINVYFHILAPNQTTAMDLCNPASV